MSWLSLLVAAVKLLTSISLYLRDRQMLSQADAAALASTLQEQANEVDKGRAARIAQRARDVGGVSDSNDPFRRD
jgi:hypothetical protein